MIIDNSNYVVNDRKIMYLTTISLTVLIPIFLLTDFFDTPVLGISKEYYVLMLGAAYICFHIYRIILDLNYIYITDESGKLTVKFYSLMPFAKKHKSMEIPLPSFSKYSVESTFFGLKKTLILYQKMQGNIAKYPPLSVSALNAQEIDKLKGRLDALSITRN